jgi:uncharacterized protein (DUF1697 family)
MRNDKLRGVFANLGFEDIGTVISSGNVIFESRSRSVRKLEQTIEKAIQEQLGFTSTTIIRSKRQLQQIADKHPFQGMEHSQKTSLNVTFLKNRTDVDLKFPHTVEDRDYTLLGMQDRAVYSVMDLTSSKTLDLFLWLEKKFGKEITTRTWKTVERILRTIG